MKPIMDEIKAVVSSHGSARATLSPIEVEELEAEGFKVRDVSFKSDSNGKRICIVSKDSPPPQSDDTQ